MLRGFRARIGGRVWILCICAGLVLWIPWAGAAAPDAPATQEKAVPPTARPGVAFGPYGPYKVIAGNFTGRKDGIADLAVAYLSGVVTVEKGDGKGGFSRAGVFGVPMGNRPEVENIFNIAQGDIDGDGLPDLALGVGGTAQSPEGRAVLVKNMGHGRLKLAEEFPSESMAKGIALADLDKDGRLDVMYTARGAGYPPTMILGKLYIRQGLGDWKFEPPLEFEAGHSAYYVETADLNNDGFLDVLVPNEHADTVQVYLNPGKDCFKDAKLWKHAVVHVTAIEGRHSPCVNDVRAADFHGDGKLDLVTANLGCNTISIFRGNGDGTFQKDVVLEGGIDPAFLAVGDLRKNGRLDFVVTHWTQNYASVFLNKGDGTFLPPKDCKCGLGCYGITLCDVDGDGILDIVTANYRERSLSVLKGNGDGTFQPPVTTPKGLLLKDGAWKPE